METRARLGEGLLVGQDKGLHNFAAEDVVCSDGMRIMWKTIVKQGMCTGQMEGGFKEYDS